MTDGNFPKAIFKMKSPKIDHKTLIVTLLNCPKH